MKSPNWQSYVENQLNVRLGQMQMVGGGDFAESFRAQVAESDSPKDIAEGQLIFIKTHRSPPPNHFTTEAQGLRWLKEADAVAVPTVLGVSDETPFLALEWVHEAGRNSSSEASLGTQLAKLHQSACPCFGREDLRTTGSLGLPNEPCERWSDFYATQRLLPLAEIAGDRRALDSSTLTQIERLASKLSEFEELDVPPSRLHGDLWAGNRLVDEEGTNWLIDPACHGGHREFDLSMMRLFGGYGDQCFGSYQDSFPLAYGWQERISLHQLAPLIVHAIKFGHSYVSPTREALARYV